MNKVWRADNPYDSLVIMVGLFFGFSVLNMFTVGLNVTNSVFAVVTFVICGFLVRQAWKIFHLDVIVNKYLIGRKCVGWVEEVTPVFWSGRLASVVVDLTQYFVAGLEGKYDTISDDVDERVTVYRFVFDDDLDRVMIVVEYQGQVDVYINKQEDEDE